MESLLPLHCHQVAKPLVSNLVCYIDSDVLQVINLEENNNITQSAPTNRHDLLVIEEGGLSVGDQAPVLHRSTLEIGNGDHVQLGQWIVGREQLPLAV